MAMTAKERQQALALAIVLAIAAGALFWVYWRGPKVEQQLALQGEVDTLRIRIDSALQDFSGNVTVEDLRQRNRDLEVTLERMKQLVPTGNDVPALIDSITTRARRNGLEVVTINPLGDEITEPFNVTRYQWAVVGHYDDIGVMMSDIAKLSRIMVPYDVRLTLVDENDQDSTRSLVRADFRLRTFVKPAQAPEMGGGAGGDN